MIFNNAFDDNQSSAMDIDNTEDKMEITGRNLFNVLSNEVLEKIAGYNINISFDVNYDKNSVYITMYKYDEILDINIMNFTTINGIIYRQLSNVDIEKMVHFIQNMNSGVFFKTPQIEFIVNDRITIKTVNCKIQLKNNEKINNSFRTTLVKAIDIIIKFPQQPIPSLISPRCL